LPAARGTLSFENLVAGLGSSIQTVSL